MKWKKSKKRFHAPKIVHTGTPERKILASLIFVLSAALAWNIFDFGREQGGFDSEQTELVESSMLADMNELESGRDACTQQLARFKQASLINKQAVQLVREEVVELQQKLSKSEQQLAFYRGLVDEGYKKNIQVRGFSLTGNSKDQYQYELLLTHLDPKAKSEHYRIEIEVEGKIKDKKVSLNNKKLGIKQADLSAKFEHYHEFKGGLTIASNIDVDRVNLAVYKGKKKKSILEQSWHWEELLGDPVSH